MGMIKCFRSEFFNQESVCLVDATRYSEGDFLLRLSYCHYYHASSCFCCTFLQWLNTWFYNLNVFIICCTFLQRLNTGFCNLGIFIICRTFLKRLNTGFYNLSIFTICCTILKWLNTSFYILIILIWKYWNFKCYRVLCLRSLLHEVLGCYKIWFPDTFCLSPKTLSQLPWQRLSLRYPFFYHITLRQRVLDSWRLETK